MTVPQSIIDPNDIGREPHIPIWFWLGPLLLIDCAIALAIMAVVSNVVLL